MRFMVLVKADKDTEAGIMPSTELLAEMGKFNEELVKAGVMLAGEGLHPSSKGARVKFAGTKRTVIDGPFAETKELIAGFWLWQVQVEGRGDRVGQALPHFDGGDRDRDSPGVRGRGLRRGVHARAAGAGRAVEGEDRRQALGVACIPKGLGFGLTTETERARRIHGESRNSSCAVSFVLSSALPVVRTI